MKANLSSFTRKIFLIKMISIQIGEHSKRITFIDFFCIIAFAEKHVNIVCVYKAS